MGPNRRWESSQDGHVDREQSVFQEQEANFGTRSRLRIAVLFEKKTPIFFLININSFLK
jgi:hypothetical protein